MRACCGATAVRALSTALRRSMGCSAAGGGREVGSLLLGAYRFEGGVDPLEPPSDSTLQQPDCQRDQDADEQGEDGEDPAVERRDLLPDGPQVHRQPHRAARNVLAERQPISTPLARRLARPLDPGYIRVG